MELINTGTIVWLSIHHKTSLWGRPYSFLDPNYIGNYNGVLDARYVPSPDTSLMRLYSVTSDNNDTVIIPENHIFYRAPSSLSTDPSSLYASSPYPPPPLLPPYTSTYPPMTHFSTHPSFLPIRRASVETAPSTSNPTTQPRDAITPSTDTVSNHAWNDICYA